MTQVKVLPKFENNVFMSTLDDLKFVLREIYNESSKDDKTFVQKTKVLSKSNIFSTGIVLIRSIPICFKPSKRIFLAL